MKKWKVSSSFSVKYGISFADLYETKQFHYSINVNSIFVAPTQRAPRRPRAATKGKQLDRMTKVMQRRLPIAVEEGKKRPHEPVQAAKFASEAGIIIRETMPILTRWKDYKDDQKYYNSFVSQLNVSALLILWFTCILLNLN